MTVRCGADVAHADDWAVLDGRTVGVLTNPTGILDPVPGAGAVSIVDAMVRSGRVRVGAVLGPEHGFRGSAQAGASESTTVDERTGVTVFDLYDATPDTVADRYDEAGLDTVVVDLQDVGARFYTYVWTMYDAMVAAARTGRDVVVLDRPNPIGGTAYGPVVQDGFTSGVGGDRIALQHGMTAGELARFLNGECLPARAGTAVAGLHVTPVEGWDRSMLFADTGLVWVPPSPNMPTPDTAIVYPGTGLFEGTNLSEGRGTTHPFEIIGAPYVDHHWAERLTAARLPGVVFRETSFVPTFSQHEGRLCHGVQLHLVDPCAVDAITTATTMITTLRDLYDDFGWRDDDGHWIDLLAGSDRFRTMIDNGADAGTIVGEWSGELAAFDRARRPYLLYPGR